MKLFIHSSNCSPMQYDQPFDPKEPSESESPVRDHDLGFAILQFFSASRLMFRVTRCPVPCLHKCPHAFHSHRSKPSGDSFQHGTHSHSPLGNEKAESDVDTAHVKVHTLPYQRNFSPLTENHAAHRHPWPSTWKHWP